MSVRQELKLARECAEKKDWKGVRQHAGAARKADKTSYQACVLFALADTNLWDAAAAPAGPPFAEAAYRCATQLDPASPVAWKGLAELLCRLGPARRTDAAAALVEAAARLPSGTAPAAHAELLDRAAALYEAAQDWPHAAETYRAAATAAAEPTPCARRLVRTVCCLERAGTDCDDALYTTLAEAVQRAAAGGDGGLAAWERAAALEHAQTVLLHRAWQRGAKTPDALHALLADARALADAHAADALPYDLLLRHMDRDDYLYALPHALVTDWAQRLLRAAPTHASAWAAAGIALADPLLLRDGTTPATAPAGGEGARIVLAQRFLETAVRAAPQTLAAWERLAALDVRAGDSAGALEHCVTALQHAAAKAAADPTATYHRATAALLLVQGRAHEAVGHLPLALASYRAAVDHLRHVPASTSESQQSQHVEGTEAFRKYVETLLALGQVQAAEEELSAALAVRPDDVWLLTAGGRAALAAQSLDEARARLEQARALAPDDGAVHLWLGRAYWALGGALRRDKAHAHAEFLAAARLGLVRRAPCAAEAFAQLGEYDRLVETGTGADARAVQCYEKAVALDALNSTAGRPLCALYEAAGRAADAQRLCERVTAAAPRSAAHAWAWRGLGVALAARGALERAAECLLAAARLQPDSAECWHRLAAVHARLGRRVAAHKAAARARALQPDSAAAQLECALAALRLCQLDAARARLEPLVAGAARDCPLALQALVECRALCARRELALGAPAAAAAEHLAAARALIAETAGRPAFDACAPVQAAWGAVLSAAYHCPHGLAHADLLAVLARGADCYARAIALLNRNSSSEDNNDNNATATAAPVLANLAANCVMRATVLRAGDRDGEGEGEGEAAARLLDEAEGHARAALRADGACAAYWDVLGAVQLARGAGAHGRAQQCLARALALDPDCAAAWLHTGVLALRCGDLEAAHRAFAAAQTLSPACAAPVAGLALVYEMDGLAPSSGHRSSAAAALATLAQLRALGTPAAGLAAAGFVALAQGAWHRAVVALREYHALSPSGCGTAWSQAALARAHERCGDLDAAHAALARARALLERTGDDAATDALPDALLARGATLVAQPYSLRRALAVQAALLAVERGETSESKTSESAQAPHLVLLAALRRGDVGAAASALFAAGAAAVVRGLVAPSVAASVAAQARRHAEGAALLLAAAEAADADETTREGALLAAALVLLAAGRRDEATAVQTRLVRACGPTAGAMLLDALGAECAAEAVRAIERALRAGASDARCVRSCVAVGLALCLRARGAGAKDDAETLARCTCAVAALAARSDDADALVLDALVGVLQVERARTQGRARTAAALRALLQDALRAHPDDARLWALAAAAREGSGAGVRLEGAVACAAAPVPACEACLAAAIACAADQGARTAARPASCACADHTPDTTTTPTLVMRVVACMPLFSS